MSSASDQSPRVAAMRVTQQEYKALQNEAKRQGYKLSHLLRHRVFGQVTKPIKVLHHDDTNLRRIINQLTNLGRDLGENGIHIRLIAESLDEGFRNAFGLDFCLRLLEGLSEELQHVLTQIENNAMQASCCRCEDQIS